MLPSGAERTALPRPSTTVLKINLHYATLFPAEFSDSDQIRVDKANLLKFSIFPFFYLDTRDHCCDYDCSPDRSSFFTGKGLLIK